ncbi:Aste57867_24324 [Aphanomyces stellatus]|uniref:Aste57867_24324 protein n=1 Tax=Aphanomyces stellatus TaxID=120398 RepID=A0A485LQ70_9STRA|nr:hypothetical protein As57867_024249 [Aphanomyces stellatus]VFU00964.1 Aste57867_24324 [Aphanomyces stellatus]
MSSTVDWLTYGVTCASLVIFIACFHASHHLSIKYIPVFRTFSLNDQANWCSRVGSTVHATVICMGILYSLTQQSWDAQLRPLHSTHLAMGLFSWSIAYFAYDLFLVVYYKIPMWHVFVAHHLVAMIPFCIYNFYRGHCMADTYLLSLYLLVELCVVPMNIVSFLEQLGHAADSPRVFLYASISFVSWVLVRGLLPIYLLYALWTTFIPSIDLSSHEAWVCTAPAIICGHLISLFCVGCLVFIITPEFRARLKARSTRDRSTYGTFVDEM